MRMHTISRVIAIFLLSGSPLAYGISCSGHLTVQERMICRDPALQAADFRLNALYAVALDVSHRSETKANQRQWLRNHRDRCGDGACLLKAYQEQNDKLMSTIRRGADPVPMVIYGEARHMATKSPYCRMSSMKAGDWFVIDAVVNDKSISGSIDGEFDCGRKVWGGVEISGTVTDNMAIVRFQPGFHEEQDPLAEALIVAKGGRLYWRVLTEYNVESYVPQVEVARVSVRPPEYESNAERY